MEIKSKVIPNCIWKIKRDILLINGNRVLKHNKEIVKIENDFIANYRPIVYTNDLTGVNWCFDTKLPTGGWLENITVKMDETRTLIFNAIIMA